jgi:hypothetical protein
VLQIGLAVAIEFWLPDLRDPAYGVKLRVLKHRVTAGVTQQPMVLMGGSSRVEYGLLGQPLEQQLAEELGTRPVVFNFGITAGGALTQLLVINRLVGEGIRPDLMLVEVFPPNLSVNTGLNELPRLTPERLWLDELPLLANFGARPLPELRVEWWQGWPAPSYSHRHAILTRLAPLFLPGGVVAISSSRFDDSGMGPTFTCPRSPEEHQHAVAATIAQYRPWFHEFRLGGACCDALRETLRLCRREHIGAALVLMPEATEYRDTLYSPESWAQIEAFVADLSREFDVPVINARDWVPSDEFADGHHLIAAGAERFTERLGREHLAPLLRGTRPALP